MKTFKFGTYAVAVLCALTLSACGGGASDETTSPSTPADPAPTDGSQSKADLAGYGYSCVTLSGYGSTIDGNFMDQYLKLNADGTYDFSTHIYSGGGCAYGHGTGTAVTQVNVSGTYAIGGTNTTPSTSTKLTFTSTSSTFTVYYPTSGSSAQALATAIADWANHCSGGNYASYPLTGSGSRSFNPLVCSSYGNVNLASSGVPPTVGATQINIGYRSGASNFQTGALNNPPWSPGAGSFPSSYAVTWQ